MKTFTWLLTLAFVIVSLTCWSASSWVLHALEGFKREALPAFTVFILYPSAWILFCPLPWLIYAAILSRRRELSGSSTLFFAGTLFLAAALLLCAVVAACILPFFNMTMGIHK